MTITTLNKKFPFSTICTTVIAVLLGLNSNAQQCAANKYTNEFTGDATYYSASGLGNCGIEYPSDAMYGAMNKEQYYLSEICGACAELTRNGKKVIVQILDQCPECKFGDIDLSPTAFNMIAQPIEGRVKMQWKLIPCPLDKKISIKHKDGTSIYYSSVQVRNAVYPIKKLELKKTNGTYENIARTDYNYFVDPNGFFDGQGPAGPYTFRITDIFDRTVSVTVPYQAATVFSTDQQFSLCSGTTPPIVTAISDKDMIENYLQVFPNPFTTDININIPSNTVYTNVEMYSLNGSLVKSTSITKGSTSLKIPADGNIAQGIYVVKLIGPKKSVVVKVFKK